MDTSEAADAGLDFVPCEFCDEPIPFDTYMEHARGCRARSYPHPVSQGPSRTALVVRDDDDGRIYRIFIDEALHALRMAPFLRQNVHSDIGNDHGNDETHPEGGIVHDDEEDSNNEDEEVQNEESWVGTPQVHRSVVVIPRVIMGPFENIPALDGYEFNTLISETIGIVPVGVKCIDNVVKPIDNTLDNDICPICYEHVVDVATLCDHHYCMACITKWLKEHKTCPVCKEDLEERCNKNLIINPPSDTSQSEST
jgi:hypothetical protein